MGKPCERKKGLEHGRQQKTQLRKYERMGKVGKRDLRDGYLFSKREKKE